MIFIKILAVLFAVAVLTKIILLAFRRNFLFQISEKFLQDRQRAMKIYGIGAAIVGLPVLLYIDIVEVAAVMLWTSLLIGLGLLSCGDLLSKYLEEIKQINLANLWWLLGIWGVWAIYVLLAVFSSA
ncbi:MAG: hypothetical protein PHW74_02805 [Desulfobacca sp.]|nr:hypothetical protein [Desulfobacca sp.]